VTYSVAIPPYSSFQQDNPERGEDDMIDLELCGTAGGAVYLDVQQAESRHSGGRDIFALVGTLGDGVHEGQVLVEIGPTVEVTFVDEWLPGGDLDPLFRRLGRETVAKAIVQAASGLLFCVEDSLPVKGVPRITGYSSDGRWFNLRPRDYGEQLELPLLVAEPAAAWERRAA
jgi:hypothetical protein